MHKDVPSWSKFLEFLKKNEYRFRKNTIENENMIKDKWRKSKPQEALRSLIEGNEKLWSKYQLRFDSCFQDGGPKEAFQYIVVGEIFFGKPFEQLFDIELWCDVAREGCEPRFCFSIDLDGALNKVVVEYAIMKNFHSICLIQDRVNGNHLGKGMFFSILIQIIKRDLSLIIQEKK